MARGIQKRKGKKGPSRKEIQPGDVYTVRTDVEVDDIDGDGVSDVVFTHSVDKNGESFVECKVVWYGLGPQISELFVQHLAGVGFIDEDSVELHRFGQVVKHWKQLTKALAGINKLGDDATLMLGEQIEG